MIRRVLLSALLAGLLAGAFVTVAQMVRVTPLILQAEHYENAGAATSHDHAHHHAGAGEPEAWAPEDGVERTLFTLLANVLTGIGFGLLLTAAFVLRGRGADLRSGALWGLGGFAVFSLAPALGLPPELPGTEAAALGARQTWWLAAVVATGLGLAAVVFASRTVLKALGAGLVLLPHLIGAPHPEAVGGSVPPELAAQFAVASIATAALFWIVLGGASGHFFKRLGGAG